MRTQGLTPAEVQERLKRAQQNDQHYVDGKILCSMCTAAHPVAKAAHETFLDTNLGDPGLFPGTAGLEKEAIADLLELLHAPQSGAGFIVSGGTEANLLAMYAARNAADHADPEVIVPVSAHFSFTKICDMLSLKLVDAKLNETFRVDVGEVERLISPRTVAIVGNAGAPELGTVDPLEELSRIAVAHGVPLHVDAAFGGLVLPFLKKLGYPTPPFDFALDGVQSMTVDPHKMGLSTIPAGGILFRNQRTLQTIQTQTPYLTQNCQCTFIGTRSGASAAATWAVFNSLGREGFVEIVKQCMATTTFLCEGLRAAGFTPLITPTMNIVAFRAQNAQALAEQLRQRGWYVSYVPRLQAIRVVIMPHTSKSHIECFLQCLTELTKTSQT
jgi:tyrosine decarboxylase/aspartate 1-decarboxylase